MDGKYVLRIAYSIQKITHDRGKIDQYGCTKNFYLTMRMHERRKRKRERVSMCMCELKLKRRKKKKV